MNDVVRLEVGDVTLTRVPYFDVPLDPVVIGLSADQVRSVSWAQPTWASADGQVLVGQAVWVVESERRTIVVDPCGAADAFIRTGPEAVTHQEAVWAAMRAGEIPPERVDAVVLTHLDGIGMTAAVDAHGQWVPAFANARVIMTNAELRSLETVPAMGIDALRALIDQGVVDGVDAPYELTSDVSIEATGGHTPGHAVVRVRSRGEEAVLLGHLAVSPIQVVSGRCPALHADPDRAAEVLGELAHEGALVVGPLWPYPGAGRIGAAGQVAAILPS